MRWQLCIIFLMVPLVLASPEDLLTEDLRATYTEEGIIASTGHFNDLWVRDAMFASWGSLEIGDHEIVRATLDTVLSHEKEGLLPLKIARGSQTLKLIGIDTKWPKKVYYETDKSNSPPIDSNCLTLITLDMYVHETGDLSLLEDWGRIMRIYKWQLAQDTDGNGLIEQGEYSDWADSLKREGELLYANACFAASTDSVIRLSGRTGRHERTSILSNQGALTLESLELFNRGDYYSERADSETVDIPANLLMMHWKVKPYSQRWFRYLSNQTLGDKHLPVTTWPKHPIGEKSGALLLAGMGDYHEEQRWSWVAGLQLLVLREYDDNIYSDFSSMWRQKIEEEGGVYEVYEPDGTPLRRLLYRSEKPFAWGSGVMLVALSQ